jgi:hypothetical protein
LRDASEIFIVREARFTSLLAEKIMRNPTFRTDVVVVRPRTSNCTVVSVG